MLNTKEIEFVGSINNKIKKYEIDATLKEVLSFSSGTLIETTYNDKTTEIVDAGIEKFLCSRSPYYFIKRYCYISVPNMGIIPFDLYYFQEEMLKEIQQYKRYVLLKSRQVGLSTVSSFYCLWRALFKPSESIAIVSKKKDAAQDFISKMKVTLDYLPHFLRQKIVSSNMSSIKFGNESEVKSEARSPNAGRSSTLSLLVLDEAAFYGTADMAEQIVASAMPTLTRTGGSILIISCYTKDTWINTENGLEQIADYIPENCQPGYNKIPSFNIDGIEHSQITDTFYDSGITPIKEITLRNKTNLKVSNIHPIYTLGEDGFPDWKQAKDIKIGDKALFSMREKTFGENDYIGFDWLKKSRNEHLIKYKLENFDGYITEDMAYFFGLLIGDGYFNKKGQYAVITNTDKEVTDFLFNNKHFKDFYVEDRKDDSCHFRVHGKYLINLLEHIGFDEIKAKEKTIPKRLLSMSRKNIRSLLQGLFDSDGHTRSNRGEVGFTSTSSKLIDQVKMLLSMFGIYVGQEQWNITKPTDRVKVESLVCQLGLSRYFSKLFFEKIGFRIKRKQNTYKLVKNSKSFIVYPNMGKTIKETYKHLDIANGLSRLERKGWKPLSHKIRGKDASPESIKYYLDYFDGILESEAYYKIKDFYDKEWVPVEITNIKDGEEHTYDFVIPETRSLYANSIIGSNTPNGMNGQGKYYFEQVQQLMLSGNTPTDKLLEVDWFEVPDVPRIYPHKGYNQVLQKYIDKDYYNNPELRREMKAHFKPIQDAWKENDWLRAQYNVLQEAKFRQEILHDFVTMGSSVFNNDILKRIESRLREPASKNVLGNSSCEGLWIWKSPIPTKRYICCSDVSTGTGSDFSTIQILDVESYEQVAEFHAHISTPNFSNTIKKVANYYNQAYVVIESNSIGEAVFNSMYYDEYEPYKNVFKQEKTKNNITRMTGWVTDIKTRKLIVNEIIDWLSVDELFDSLKLYSSRLYTELSTWVWKENGKAEHTEGSKDDLIIAFALALYNRNKALTSGISFIIDEKGKFISSNGNNESRTTTASTKDDFYGIVGLDEFDGNDFERNIKDKYGVDVEQYKWLST